MVRIPKASESEGEGFKLPENGSYTAVVIDIDDPAVSAQTGKMQQLFKWELVAMFDEDETEWVTEFEDKGTVLHDYVNIESFFDGGGDPTRVSKLYKIGNRRRSSRPTSTSSARRSKPSRIKKSTHQKFHSN
jgi:hypothetical protein